MFPTAFAEEPELWSDRSWFPGAVLLTRHAAVSAALVQADDLLEEMAEMAHLIGVSDEEAVKGAQLSRSMQKIRIHVESVRTTTLPELVNAIPDIGPDPYRAVEWLAKNRELTLEGRGQTLRIIWGHAREKPVHRPHQFRAHADLVLSTPLDMSLLQSPLGDEQWRGGLADERGASEPADGAHNPPGRVLQPPHRLASPMRTLTLTGATWLVGNSKSSAGVNPTTLVVVKDDSGNTVNELTLDHEVHRLFESGDLEHAVFLDKAGTVYAYDVEGVAVARVALAPTPEYRYFDSLPFYDHASSIRAVDIDIAQETLVFSLANAVYRFRFDGSLVSAVNLPFWPGGFGWWDGDRPYGKVPNILERLGKPGSLTARQAASVFREPAMQSDRHLIAPVGHPVPALTDGSAPVVQFGAKGFAALKQLWIAIQFPRMDYAHCIVMSRLDDTVYVATHSGLLLQLTPGGAVLNSWLIPSHALAMRQLDDGTVVVANEVALALVRAGESPVIVDGLMGRPTFTESYLVKRTDRTIRAVKLGSGSTGTVQLESAFRAAYEIAGALAVEGATKRYLLRLS